MGFIAGHALDGSMVAIDTAMISLIKEVPTASAMGQESWDAQTAKWRKENPVVTVVTTRQTPNQLETFFPVPILNVMYCINQSVQTTNSDAFMMVETLQAYDTNELTALTEGDKDSIKENSLFMPQCLHAEA